MIIFDVYIKRVSILKIKGQSPVAGDFYRPAPLCFGRRIVDDHHDDRLTRCGRDKEKSMQTTARNRAKPLIPFIPLPRAAYLADVLEIHAHPTTIPR